MASWYRWSTTPRRSTEGTTLGAEQFGIEAVEAERGVDSTEQGLEDELTMVLCSSKEVRLDGDDVMCMPVVDALS